MDWSQNTLKNYLSDEKTHAAIKGKHYKELGHVNNALYEVELAKAQLEQKEPIVFGFFIFQYANLRMLKRYYNFCYPVL